MQLRRVCLTLLASLAGLSMAPALMAQTLPKPFVLYDDELKNGWQNWSWATVDLSANAGGAKPIRVKGAPWSALALRHDAFSTAGYTKLTFSINGGAEGEQSLAVKATLDGKPIESNYIVKLKAKTWSVVEVPLKEIGAEGKTIDGFWVQGQAAAYGAYYITRIKLE